jgi:CBS domain-containing protein
MRISDVLRRKGDMVATITPHATVRTLLAQLAEYGIGAMVVSDSDGALQGIVSERDVVRALQAEGDGILDGPVSSIMTADVHTCGPSDTVVDMARAMTERRIRHVPVLADNQLVGIVSIGDIVKQRIDELTAERDHLSAYIST